MALEHWNIDVVHSNITFTVRHLLVSKSQGVFTRWSGTFSLDEINPSASHVEVTIDVASVDTRDEKRDEHLRSVDFFDAATFPQMTFTSTSVERSGENYKVTGDLMLRGVVKPVVLDIEDGGRMMHPQHGARAGFSARASINRKDFGVSFNRILDTGLALGERVDIAIEIAAGKSS